jgi:hypothetical protein
MVKQEKARRLNLNDQVKLMPLDAVADALGVSIYTVRRLVSAGSLQAVPIGARVMVSSAVVAQAQREGIPRSQRVR